MSEKMTREEERELLELQAKLSRLKIQVAQAKKKQARRKENAPADNILHLVNSAGSFVSNNSLLKLAMLPTSWKYRVLLGGTLLAWEYYRNRPTTPPSQRRLIDITPPTLYLEDKQKDKH